jgi:hypothetical protein
VTANLRAKLDVLREKPVVIGGTFLEVVLTLDKLDGYKRWLGQLGLTHVEISDGVIELERERKLELIADFARDFTVLSEVGSKDPDTVYPPSQWINWIKEELDAGAWKVITEGRESGTAGIYQPTGEMRTDVVDQAIRPDREPREHSARRGDRARDPPPRSPRRHPEGGARWRSHPGCLSSTSRRCRPRSCSASATPSSATSSA